MLATEYFALFDNASSEAPFQLVRRHINNSFPMAIPTGMVAILHSNMVLLPTVADTEVDTGHGAPMEGSMALVVNYINCIWLLIVLRLLFLHKPNDRILLHIVIFSRN